MKVPSIQPTTIPSKIPSGQPSSSPSRQPSKQPTSFPSLQPSKYPTSQPLLDPSSQPSSKPSTLPSSQPSNQPLSTPSVQPSRQPSFQPSKQPSRKPTIKPTLLPSEQPSRQPIMVPSNQPTTNPSPQPSFQPSKWPSSQPILKPSKTPTLQPSRLPTCQPTCQPSKQPTGQPFFIPSNQPSSNPTKCPSNQPNSRPSAQPNSHPSNQPSIEPSHRPSKSPSSRPSNQPFVKPSSQPSKQPGSHPSKQPTLQPNRHPSIQPSRQPFHYPTKSPSCQPSSEPSKHIELKYINITSIDSISLPSQLSRYQIQISVKLVEKTDSFVICGAFLQTQSVMQLITYKDIENQNYKIFSTNSRVTVNFIGLEPSGDYNIICYTKSLSGNVMPLPIAFALHIQVTTACCKSIYIHYDAIGNSLENTVINDGISIKFSHNPSVSLSLNLLIQRAGKQLVNESFKSESFLYPSYFKIYRLNLPFTSKVSLFTGISGLYILNATLSGSSANEYAITYSNHSQYFNIIKFNVGLSYPFIKSAILSENSRYIVLSFDKPTDRGGFRNYFPCNNLLHFVNMNLTRCLWNDDLNIHLYPNYYGYSADSISIGSKINIRSDNIIGPSCSVCTKNISGPIRYREITVQANEYVQYPSVVVSSPTSIDECADFPFDISNSIGNGGRDWGKISIEVIDSQTRNVNAIQSFVNTAFSISLTNDVPAHFFLSGHNYTFNIILCSYIMVCGRGSHTIQVIKSDLPTPAVVIFGSTLRTIYRSSPLSLNARAYIQNCATNFSTEYIQYIWQVSNISSGESIELLSQSRDPSIFKLFPYTLVANSGYLISVTAYHSITQKSRAYSVQVYVLTGTIVASIKGNAHRLEMVNTVFTIDASSSYDDDYPGIPSWLTFSWSCVQIRPYFNLTCPLIDLSDGVQNYSISFLSRFSSDNVTARVYLNVFDSFRSSETYVDISLTNKPISTINIVNVNQTTKFNTNSSLWLIGSLLMTSDCNATWSLDDSLLQLSTLLITPSYQIITAGSKQYYHLQIPANKLLPNSQLTFSLTCGSTISSITLHSNSPPIPGRFTILPIEGIEIATIFTFTATGWFDEDLPMVYQFSYLSNSGIVSFLNSLSESTYLKSNLPSGNLNSTYTLSCQVYVSDSIGAIDTMESIVHVIPSVQNDLINVISTLSSVPNMIFDKRVLGISAITTRSLPEIKSILAVYSSSSVLNNFKCSNAPNCSALHRNQCTSTIDTCGSCYENYIGDLGDSNFPCLSLVEYTRYANISTMSSVCKLNADCHNHWYYCNSNNICQVKMKVINSPYCTLNGVNTFVDTRSGLTVKSCAVSDEHCISICICNLGFTGKLCELSIDNLVSGFNYKVLIREQLLDGLNVLLANDDVNIQNVLQWVTYLSSIAILSPYELSNSAINKIYNAISVILSQATAILMPIDVVNDFNEKFMNGLLDIVDTLASVHRLGCSFIPSGGTTLGVKNFGWTMCGQSVNNFIETLIFNTVSSYTDLILNSFVAGRRPICYIYSNYQFCSQMLNLNGGSKRIYLNTTSAVSIRDEISKTSVQSLQLNCSLSGPTTSTRLSTIELNAKSSNKAQLLSNPLYIKLYQLTPNVDVLKSVSNYEIRIINNIKVFSANGMEKPLNFTTICKGFTDFTTHQYTCPDSGVIISQSCKGVAGSFINYCPIRIPSCGMNNIVNNSKSLCKLLNYTEIETYCQCQIRDNHLRNPLVTANSQQWTLIDLAAFQTEYSFIPYYKTTSFAQALFIKTLRTINQSTFIFLTYFSMWFTLFFLILFNSKYFNFRKSKVEAMDTRRIAVHSNQISAQDIHGKILNYINSYFPSVYNMNESMFQRFLREIKSNHQYLKLCNLAPQQYDYIKLVIEYFRIMTYQFTRMIILLLFFEIQWRNDDNSCGGYDSSNRCLERKLPFDPTLSYCSWNKYIFPSDGKSYYLCEYANPVYSTEGILYLIIISIALTSLCRWPIDKIFDAIQSKRKGNKKFSMKSVSLIGESLELESDDMEITDESSNENPSEVNPNASQTLQKYRITSPELYKSRYLAEHGVSVLISISLKNNKQIEQYIDYSINYKEVLLKKNSRVKSVTSTVPNSDKLITAMSIIYVKTLFSKGISDYIKSNQEISKSSMTQEPTKIKLQTPNEVLIRNIHHDKLKWGIDKLKSQVSQQRTYLISLRENCLTKKEFDAYNSIINAYDQSWGLVLNKFGKNNRFSWLSRKKVHNNNGSYDKYDINFKIQKLMNRDIQYSDSFAVKYIEEMKKSQRFDIGIELLRIFVTDLMGRHSWEAQIFNNKFNAENKILYYITENQFICSIILSLLFNIGYFVVIIIIGMNKEFDWQIRYFISSICLFLFEVFVMSTLECMWIHFFLPDISFNKVRKARNKIMDCLNQILYFDRLSKLYIDGAMIPPLVNYPSYVFPSHKIALKYPNTLESILIMNYHNHIPIENSDYYKKIYLSTSTNIIDYFKHHFNQLSEEYDNPPDDVQNKNLYSITTTIYLICRTLGYLSEHFQIIFTRVSICLVLFLLILIWYRGCDQSPGLGIAYIVVICFIGMFLITIIYLQLKFYYIRENKTFNRVLPMDDTTISGEEGLIELSTKLYKIREEELNKLNKFSFERDINNNVQDEMVEESKGDIDEEEGDKLWDDFCNESVSSSHISDANSIANYNKEPVDNHVSITILNNDLMEEVDENEENDVNIEILDHVSESQSELSSDNDPSTSSDNENRFAGEFQFDKYSLSHNIRAINEHHALVMQHNKRMKHI